MAKSVKCPGCGNQAEVYEGGDANRHKIGTVWCKTCGRVQLPQEEPKPEPATEERTQPQAASADETPPEVRGRGRT